VTTTDTPPPDRNPTSVALESLVHHYVESWFRAAFDTGADHLTYAHGFLSPRVYNATDSGLPVSLYAAARREAGTKRNRRIKALFIAADDTRLAAVRQSMAAAGDPDPAVPVVYGRAQDTAELVDVLESAGGLTEPVFALLDNSSGPMPPFADLARIGAAAASEVLVTFTPRHLSAFGTGEATNSAGEEVFGGTHWEGAFSQLASAKYTYLITQYRASLAMAGFKHAMSVGILDEQGSDLQVMFGTNSLVGLKAMKHAMWTLGPVEGALYRDPRDPNEESVAIRRDPETGPLRRQLLLYLGDYPDGVTVTRLRNFTLRETMYRPRHASREIRSLIGEGLIENTARGELAGPTIVRLAT
jgi:three-Cys-motif partner protein